MKVAIFHLAFIYSGGGEKLVLNEAKGLTKRGHQVTIFTPVLDRKKCFSDIIGQFNIKTLVPKLPSFIPQWETFQVILACVLAPIIAYRFRNFDVILAANQPSPWLAFWIKELFGVPYVTYLSQPTRFLHPRKIDQKTGLIFAEKRAFLPATYLMKIARPLANWADRASIKGSNLVLADGEYVKGLLENTYGVKTTVCPAGAYPANERMIETNRFEGSLKIKNKNITKPYILLTNRHFPQKKLEYAITILPVLLRKFPNLLLVITGAETNYTKELKKLIKRLSLEKKVLFLGLVKEKELEKLYSQAAVYSYTAPEEDFGMGMVEAMALGTPVVAWNKAGPTGIVVDGKTGFLAKPFDVAEFADKILKLLADKKLNKRLGRQALGRVKSLFSYNYHLEVLEFALKQTTQYTMAYPPFSSFANRRFWYFSYVLEALKEVKGEVLDIGCGRGSLTSEIKKFRPDLKMTGCDKEKQKHLDGKINITYGDAHQLPFPEDSFNGVLMLDVLEHLVQPVVALKEVCRVLRRGGIFHLAVPCEESLATWDGWLYRVFKLNLKRQTVGHIQLFSFKEVKKMLKNQGFEVVDFHFSQHFIDQFFSLLYYLFVWLFRHGRYFNLRQKGESFLPLAFLLKLGGCLSNLESKIFQKVRGRMLHITCQK